MSNARVRQFLEKQSAPVIAWLIDRRYVYDDGGILNTYAYHAGEAVTSAKRELNGAVPVPIPDIRPAWERAHTPYKAPGRVRERL